MSGLDMLTPHYHNNLMICGAQNSYHNFEAIVGF